MARNGLQQVRQAKLLDTTYVTGDGKGAENDVRITGVNQIVLFLNLTKVGGLTSVEVKVEVSLDGRGFYQELAASVSGSTAKLKPLEYSIDTSLLATDSCTYLPVPVLGDLARISVKGTGTVTGTSMAVVAAVGRT